MNLADDLRRKFGVPAYKFLNNSDVHFWTEKSTIALRKLSYYRKIEDQWIGDQGEGRTSSFVRDATTSKDREFRARLAAEGMHINVPDVKLHNIHFVKDQPDHFVFCAALDPFNDVKKAMCEDAPPEYRYDACILISNFAEFLINLVETGHIVGSAESGQPMGKLLPKLKVNRVTYDDRDIDLTVRSGHIDPVFVKPASFRGQQEIRVRFYESRPIEPETLIVKFDPTDVVSRLF